MIDRINPRFSKRPANLDAVAKDRIISNVSHVSFEQKSHWKALYDLAYAPTADGLLNWEHGIPSEGCKCTERYYQFKTADPPDFSSPMAFFHWANRIHNAVNRKLARREFTLGEALTLWRHVRPWSSRTKALVTVATGREFRNLLQITEPLIRSYAARCDADYIALTNSTKSWWGLEKFRTRHFVEQYEEVLFVDADCIIKPNAPSLFGQDCDAMLHDDAPYLETLDWLKSERKQVCDAIGIEYKDNDLCLNSGVVYTRKDASTIWAEPTGSIPTSHCAEQIVVEQQAISHGYGKLDSRFNWQFYFKDFYAGLEDAYIVHLATCKTKLDTAKSIIRDFCNGSVEDQQAQH